MCADRWRVTEHHLPPLLPRIEIDRRHRAIRRLDQRQLLRRRMIGAAGVRIGSDTDAAVRQIRRVLVADRIVRRALQNPIDGRAVGRLHEQRVRLGIVRCTAPPCAADRAGHRDRALHRRWREDRPAAVLCEHLARATREFRREVDQVVRGDSLARERRRQRRHRLRWRGAFTRDITRRHRAFDNRPDRLPCHAIEHIDPRRLRRHGDDIAWPAVPRDGGQHRRRGQIIVPQSVMHDLIVPHATSGARIERHDRFGEQVVTLPIAAVPVIRGC